MKKLILLLTFFVLTISVNSQSARPLVGFYAKFTLTGAQNIWVQPTILYPKTYPTTWYFIKFQQPFELIGERINWDQVIKYRFHFEIYYDYYEYWNWFQPFELRFNNILESDWIDISGEDFTYEYDLPELMADLLAVKLNIDVSQIEILNFYNP